MALRDIVIKDAGLFGISGTKRFAVAAGVTAILPGEPVAKALAATSIIPMQTNKPVVSTDYLVGIAESNSTQTASAAGVVDVFPIRQGIVYLISPKVAATWDTQAEYDALVGSRVLIDLTSGSYTILASDNSTYGCVIEPLDIAKTPGKVAFAFRSGLSYLA